MYVAGVIDRVIILQKVSLVGPSAVALRAPYRQRHTLGVIERSILKCLGRRREVVSKHHQHGLLHGLRLVFAIDLTKLLLVGSAEVEFVDVEFVAVLVFGGGVETASACFQLKACLGVGHLLQHGITAERKRWRHKIEVVAHAGERQLRRFGSVGKSEDAAVVVVVAVERHVYGQAVVAAVGEQGVLALDGEFCAVGQFHLEAVNRQLQHTYIYIYYMSQRFVSRSYLLSCWASPSAPSM